MSLLTRLVVMWTTTGICLYLALLGSSSTSLVAAFPRPRILQDIIIRGGGSGGTGGGQSSSSSSSSHAKNTTLQNYVAAMEEKDSQRDESINYDNSSHCDNSVHDNTNNNNDDKETLEPAASADTDEPPSSAATEAATDGDAVVGVKPHKKSNAVGDPDSSDDDNDDDDDDEEDSDSDMIQEWQDLVAPLGDTDSSTRAAAELQVEVEMLPQMGDTTSGGGTATTTTTGGGGVGIRLNHRKPKKSPALATTAATATTPPQSTLLLQAWLPHVYFPPPSSTSTTLESAAQLAKQHRFDHTRLDRRTLYAGLLAEWQHSPSLVSSTNNSQSASSSSSRRKFLDKATSQTLQASLSMATQPEWRCKAPQSSGISFYSPQDNNNHHYNSNNHPAGECTLAMQETIAMALAHSLGCGMVIVDDAVLQSVRSQVPDVKPAALLEALLTMAKEGKLSSSSAVASKSAKISACLKHDLELGLEDPYDERALASCDHMIEWEQHMWEHEPDQGEKPPLPLVIFVRTQSSKGLLLKSKSAVEHLMQECTSADSIHLLVLGKGIDASTTTLPPPLPDSMDSSSTTTTLDHPDARAAAAPWFGFSPQNQNASGQNDPEGSRRFNIFLARTVDTNGMPGILGAIAQPQAGNLFPHMMAMQARERLQHQEGDSPVKAELERWAQMLQQQMQSHGGTPLPPPQFFNASLSSPFGVGNNNNNNPVLPPNAQTLPPEVVQHALQQAMSELLDRLAQMKNEDEDHMSPELHKAFAQVLQNENLRRGIAENLARAAPALTDPKCQGVMLSVYVPPPPHQMNRGKLPGTQKPPGGWFQKILNNHDESAESESGGDEEEDRPRRKQRVRTMAAAAAMVASKNGASENGESTTDKSDNKADRHLAKLESLCRHVAIKTPSDPVRAKSWEAWIARERGAVIFRHNRRALNDELSHRSLSLEQHTGTRGAGSALRQMLSVRDVSEDMEDIIKCAVELEASKSRRQQDSEVEARVNESNLSVDVTLSQLLMTDYGVVETVEETSESVSIETPRTTEKRISGVKMLHPSSLETALSLVCRISPSPAGGLSVSNAPASNRSREDILALAQDKHERALVSQVVSPQDIGVTYDMIGGLSDVKELLRQSITYPLKFPHLYSEGIAREAVKGVLLFGPPGTGKTMLAKAVATEGGASFLSVDASSVENKWLGESEKNAKAVFTLARRLAPCVIFIDEVDSLLSSREGSSDDSAHGTLTSVKTTMMSEWDGLNSGTNGNGEAGSDRVVVIGSTNRPFDLDEAVLRRFPRRILVDLPDLETRTEILEVTLAENRVDPAVNLTKIAERLEGYTGSDIKEVCREAVVQISHEQARVLDQGGLDSMGKDVTQGLLQRLRPVTMDDFENALGKLKRSVSEKGRELARVWEWNDEYGEIKKDKKNHLPQLMNMYL